MRYSIDAPAKINLYLDVLSKRENGYHDIKSVMQSVSICDKITISVEKSKNTSITLYGNNNSIAWDESNLVYKACSLFIKEAGIEGYSFTIYVEKKIPIKAGMGGGSTDAAATLNLLNDIFDEKFTEDELCALGARLGADVAFCIKGGACLCEGIGEKLTPVSGLKNVYLLCAIGNSSISTPEAYALLDEKYGTSCTDSASIDEFLTNVKNGDLFRICSGLYNKFESVICPALPEIEKIKSIFMENGALGALMSGSGPSVFGIFDDEDNQMNAFYDLICENFRTFLCKPL